MRFVRRKPPGPPSFDLGEDLIATALDLICRGSKVARGHLSRRIREPAIDRMVWQGDQGDQAYCATDWERF